MWFAAQQKISSKFVLTVYNQQGLIFSGEVAALSTNNEVGPLSILPGHANFISIITDQLTVFPESNQPQEIELDRGVLRVFENDVQIYVGVELDARLAAFPR